MKQQLQELQLRIKTAELAASSQSLRHSTSSSSVASGGRDLIGTLHTIRNEQIRLHQTINSLVAEKLIPMEIRLDMFDEIGDKIYALKGKMTDSGNDVNPVAMKLEEMRRKLSGLSGDYLMQSETQEIGDVSNSQVVDFDVRKDLLNCVAAELTDMKDNLDNSHKKIYDEIKKFKSSLKAKCSDNTQAKSSDKVTKTLPPVDYKKLESLPEEKLHVVLKQLQYEIDQKEGHAKILAPIIYGQAPAWFSSKISYVNGRIVTESGKSMKPDDFRKAVWNAPQTVFPELEFGVDCSGCQEIVPLKQICKDRVSVKCNSCSNQTVFAAPEKGHRWLKFGSCGHHCLVPEDSENPEKCLLCGSKTYGTVSFLNIQEMKKQIEEMEVQMRLAEEEETRRFSMENVSQSNTNGMDVNEMLNLIRTEQSKMSLEVEQVLNEKALPLEVRMDLFQAIMEQIDDLQSENRSGKIGSTLEAVQKLDETVDELVSQHCCSNGNNHTTASKTLHQPNLKLEEDIIHSLFASISDIKGSWHLSTQKILQKLQPKTVTFQNTEETPKKPSKLTEDDATRSERAMLIHTAKQQWEHLCRLKESESVLESIIYTNDKNVWLAKRIKLVNGKIQTDCSDKQWDADDFIQELENYPWRLFTDEEYEVECWCCNTIMSVKENLQYDGVTVYCGGECDSRTILAKTKPGYCWVQCNCSHYFQFLEGEEPTECEFCESPYFQEGGDYSIMIPRRKELIMRV